MIRLRLLLVRVFQYLRVAADTTWGDKRVRLCLRIIAVMMYLVWRLWSRGLGPLDIVDDIAIGILIRALQTVIE